MAPAFEFIERLGSGNFGEVWLARDAGLNALRAVKIIPKDRLINPNNFFQEAQTLKLAEHANVVRVEETGWLDAERVYVAMEYLRRRSLEDESKGSYVPMSRVKRVMIDVLRGLGHAHTKNILHRDIKPANILVGPAGEGKLSDFGLALAANVDPSKLGIKEYKYVLHMAPEVSSGGKYSVFADIYACGVTMYRLINGDSFFSVPPADDVADLIAAGRFPDRSHYREFVPRQWRSLINKALSVDPARRFKSAEDMRHAVEHTKACANWYEKMLNNGTSWISTQDLRCVLVTRRRTSAEVWTIEVKKGPEKRRLRRVGHLCSSVPTLSQARRCTGRILQDFVLGKLH